MVDYLKELAERIHTLFHQSFDEIILCCKKQGVDLWDVEIRERAIEIAHENKHASFEQNGVTDG